MLLTITTTHRPATDLGYLLHKNPAKVQAFTQSYGTAHVYYPEGSEDRCTAALYVQIDPIGLVRGRRTHGAPLEQYVNDRPYAASSLLAVAIGDVFRSALAGRSSDRPALVDQPIPLELALPTVPVQGGEDLLRGLFEPLGYTVTPARLALDPKFPNWGGSAYYSVRLAATLPLHVALSHLYVLLPVLDNTKHYWVNDDEVEKLLRHGERWVGSHPARELIVRRYLRNRRALSEQAFARLAALEVEDEDADVAEAPIEARRGDSTEEILEKPIRLNDLRLDTVAEAIEASGATSLVDLGCGEGRLLKRALAIRRLERITGLDVSLRALAIARERLRWDRLPARDQARLALLHGGLTYRDRRIEGFDLATAVEVIEHLDPPRVEAFQRVLFECARARTVIVTTPNREYNARFERPLSLRHPDHRFEWTRAEFEAWAASMSERFGYAHALAPIGEIDPELGPPTQMAVFTRAR